MKQLKTGDRVLLRKRLEFGSIEIETTRVLVIENINERMVTLRYGTKINQRFTIEQSAVSLRLITLEEVNQLNPNKSITALNLKVGDKGYLNTFFTKINFTVFNIKFSTSIFSDFFEIITEQGEHYMTSGENMHLAGEKIKQENNESETKQIINQDIKKSSNKEEESDQMETKRVLKISDQDIKKLVNSILGANNGDVVLELPTPEEFVNKLVDVHNKSLNKEMNTPKEVSKTITSPVKPIKPIGHYDSEDLSSRSLNNKQLHENFENELIKIKEKRTGIAPKVSNIQIDGIEIELFENGEIKIPNITRKNLLEVSAVLNKLDTILKF